MVMAFIWPGLRINEQAIKSGGPYLSSLYENGEGWIHLEKNNYGDWLDRYGYHFTNGDDEDLLYEREE